MIASHSLRYLARSEGLAACFVFAQLSSCSAAASMESERLSRADCGVVESDAMMLVPREDEYDLILARSCCYT